MRGQPGVVSARPGFTGSAAPGAAVKVGTCLAVSKQAGFELEARSADVLLGALALGVRWGAG